MCRAATAVVAACCAMILTACSAFTTSETTATPTGSPTSTVRPNDFSVFYEWWEAPLPPPLQYGYTIAINSQGQSEVVMTISDFTSEQVPAWTETFTVQPAKLDELYQLLAGHDLFTQNWPAQVPPPGGAGESMVVTAHGKQITIAVYVDSDLVTKAAEMYAAVRALVPQTIWDKLDVQRQQYIQEYQE